MHLSLLIAHAPSPHTVGQWRLPGSYSGFRFDRGEYWEHIARTAERGLFDMIFLSDSYGMYDTYRGSSDDTIRHAVQYPRHDALPLIPIMARVTKKIGLVATASTTFLPPFWLARHFATLDHLTEGRVGWNVVTSAGKSEARNFGLADVVEHDERYRRAEEYMELCNKLWQSWDADAVVNDPELGVFADPAKVHRLGFKGEFFASEGPLCVAPSPQGKPFIVQAGSSPVGIDFAARHAEACFSVRHSTSGMRSYVDKLRSGLLAAGRPADASKALFGILPIVGATTSEAKAKQRALIDNVSIEGGLAMLSGMFNLDLSQFPIDRPLPELDKVSGIQGHQIMLREDFDPSMTLGEIARQFAAGQAPHVVGTAAEIADQLEALQADGGGDGFMVITHTVPSSVDDFVNYVVPELQRRGLFRKHYAEDQLRPRFHPQSRQGVGNALPRQGLAE